MRLLCLAWVGVPLLAAAASPPKLPRGFAGERFAPVTVMRGLPTPDWRSAEDYLRWASLTEPRSDAGSATTWNLDFGEMPANARSCVRGGDVTRTFELAGLGARFDFVIYRHAPERSNDPEHDHLLVFRHFGDARTLAFSCVGKLPRKVSAVAAAVAAGRCTEESERHETR